MLRHKESFSFFHLPDSVSGGHKSHAWMAAFHLETFPGIKNAKRIDSCDQQIIFLGEYAACWGYNKYRSHYWGGPGENEW